LGKGIVEFLVMASKSHNPTTTKAPGVKLTAHARGWVAKIGGKVKWLAPIGKPRLALERYHRKMAEHNAAAPVVAPAADNAVAIGHIGQLFIDSKFVKAKAREIKPRTYDGYEKGVLKAVAHFGYDTPALAIPVAGWQAYRAKLAAAYKVGTLNRHVGAVRALSKWALANEYIDRPFRFGTEFNLPSQKAVRAAKKGGGVRTYTHAQVKAVLADATPVLKAMFLLSINGGVGNTDIAKLTDGNVKGDRIEFERSKTEVARVIPLWPETATAIKAARAVRPEPADPSLADRVFLTEHGHPYVRDNLDGEGNLTSFTDKIATLFWTGMRDLGIDRSFYDGRRTFQTIGDEVGPPHVVRAIMGHSARGEDMSARYRQSIPFAQLEAVVKHVRQKLGVSKCRASAPAKPSKAGASPAKDRRGGKSGTRRRPRGGSAK
jgi:integrase